jgi:thymidylate synthase (FAD)
MVELLEVFGSDLTVVNAARVSFSKESHEMTLGDEKLIKYLAKHNHNSPFFHPQIRLRLKMPIFVAREWFRHQIGFARNEVSRRYVDSEPEFWVPKVDDIRQRDSNLKQGSKDEAIEDCEAIQEMVETHMNMCKGMYTFLIRKKVAPEVARCVLPQSMMTEFIETGSLAAYARMYGLRNDPHSQKEIREYAKKVGLLLEEKFPVSWKALTQHEQIAST